MAEAKTEPWRLSGGPPTKEWRAKFRIGDADHPRKIGVEASAVLQSVKEILIREAQRSHAHARSNSNHCLTDRARQCRLRSGSISQLSHHPSGPCGCDRWPRG